MIDKMRYLEQSAKQTNPLMMKYIQMPGVAIQNFLRQQMGDPDDENLGFINNKVYRSPSGISLVFQNGSPY